MKHQEQLLRAWLLRTGSSSTEHFSGDARDRVALLFVRQAATSAADREAGARHNELDDLSSELADLGAEADLSASAFSAELRNCQVSLLQILMAEAVERAQQQPSTDPREALRSLAGHLVEMDSLIARSTEHFVECDEASVGSTTGAERADKPGKTLQHEIRTPLQGALLTTELMLEDAGHGDPVSADDILAVRKSIETAVGILNEFASLSR